MPRSLNFEYLLTPNGLERHRRVHINDAGRIERIESATGERFDAQFVLPGMANAHSHAFQRAMVGQGEAQAGKDSFWSWRLHMYELARTIDPDDLFAIARCAYSDMLRAGFTSVGEFHYLHHLPDGSAGEEMGRAIIEAATSVGIRLIFLPVYYRCGGFGKPAQAEQARFVHASPDAYLKLLQNFTDVPCGIAPHSLRAVPAGELSELVAGAEALLGKELPIHLHISEQAAEVTQCLAHHGARPVEVLADAVGLDARWNLVHATHTDASERALIARSGARVVLCPLTEAYLGDGLFAAGEFLAAGGQWAIGSDSNVRIDAVEELRLLEYGQRLKNQRRACLADETGLGETLWRRSATAGASALCLDAGAAEPGCYADFVSLDTSSAALNGVTPDRVLDAWITGGSREDIEAVFVGGEKRVSAGAAAGSAADNREVAQAYARVMASLDKRLQA